MSTLDTLCLTAYYADNQNPRKKTSDYLDQAWQIAATLAPTERYGWIQHVLAEILFQGAAEDEQDGRELIRELFEGFPGTNEKLG